MSKTWKKDGRTFDTDRYNPVYHVVGDEFCKSVWPESPFVGPDAYNRSHIDLIVENYNNDVNQILEPMNPVLGVRATLIKFTP